MNSKIILLALLICMIAVSCTDAGRRPKGKDGKGGKKPKDVKPPKDDNTSTDKKDKTDDDDDNEDSEDRPSRRRNRGNSRSFCRRQCRGVRFDQVCANDGKDYNNRCYMFCQSSDRRVKVEYKGRCDSNSSGGDRDRSSERGIQAAGLKTGIKNKIL